MASTRIAIHGAAGRMGRRLVALASEDDQLTVAATLEAAGHAELGEDAGVVAGVGPIGVWLSKALETHADVIIDFSVPEACSAILDVAVARRTPVVVATTGLSEDQRERIREASRETAVLWSPNMSLAVNLIMKLAAVTGEALKAHPSGVDVEIIERHHRFKEDAPSGTALKIGELIAGIMGQAQHVHGRQGRPGLRPRDEIGYHALRVGDNPGEHTIVFSMPGETLELIVRASTRDCYALGALAAAKFLAGKPPGLYGMNDVLAL